MAGVSANVSTGRSSGGLAGWYHSQHYCQRTQGQRWEAVQTRRLYTEVWFAAEGTNRRRNTNERPIAGTSVRRENGQVERGRLGPPFDLYVRKKGGGKIWQPLRRWWLT